MTVAPCPYPRCSGPDGNPTLTGDGICPTCRRSVQRDLAAAPSMYVRLHLELPPASITTEKVSGTKSPAPPLRLGMLEVGSTYTRVLDQWVTLVRLATNLSPARMGGTREGWTVANAAALLLPRLDQACRISPQSALDLTATAIVARRVLKLTRLVHRLAAPCPDCDLLALYREDGTAYVRCSACGAAWAEELYASLARVIASEYDVSG